MSELHPQLAQDCFEIAQLPLCRVLLMNDAHYPWLILVPQREGLTEIYQLDEHDQQQFMRESSAISQALHRCTSADKINIAALGNMVPQLHIHHVARFKDDPAWPAPIWGKVSPSPYTKHDKQSFIKKFKQMDFQGLDIHWLV